MSSKTIGIYIHIPFCRSKCSYCDFYSLAGREDRMDDYQKALSRHIKETAPQARGYGVDTVYFGGGTPSYYGEKRLRELLALVRKQFRLTRDAEITVEVNPDSVTRRDLIRLRRAGVNRVSMGMQSASGEELQSVGRPHDHSQTCRAVEDVRSAKIHNLSLDLIYGLPGQTMEDWRASVEEAIRLAPEHLSCYGLKVEPGTPLCARVAAGEVLPDDDLQADCYLWAVKRLEEAGYHQYEISNFAKRGFQSRHNMKYWMGREYLGFGPGAHSDFGGCRYSFQRDLEGYIAGVESGGAILDQMENIPQRERCGEYLMLRLRTTRGIEEWEYRRKYFMNFDPLSARLAEFEQRGWARRVDRRWRLTPEGFLLSNRLIGDLMELQENETLEDMLDKARKGQIPPKEQE